MNSLNIVTPEQLDQFADLALLDRAGNGSMLVFPPFEYTLNVPNVIYRGPKPLKATHPDFIPRADGLFPTSVPGHKVFLTRLSDALVCNGGVIVTENNQLLSESFRNISRSAHRVGITKTSDISYRVDRPFDENAPILEGKCVFLDGEHFAGYGHFVGEVLTRTWITKVFDFFSDAKFICGADVLPYMSSFFTAAGISSDRVYRNRGWVRCRELWVPTQGFIVRESVSPACHIVWDAIEGSYRKSNGASKIYVSRGNAANRKLINELEVQDLFKTYGFEILNPEKLSVPDQIAAFSTANYIAGSSGSNMFNLAFSSKGAQVMILTSPEYIVHTEPLMRCRSDRKLTYVIGEGARSGYTHDPWQIDIVELQAQIVRWLSQQDAADVVG